MADQEQEKSSRQATRFERMFDRLFDLIRDNNKATASVTSETGKHRAAVNEVIQIFRDRPCFEGQVGEGIIEIRDQAVKTIGEAGKSAENAHIKSLSDSNDRFAKIIIWIFIISAIGNAFISGAVLVLVDRNPQVWEVIMILLQNGGK